MWLAFGVLSPVLFALAPVFCNFASLSSFLLFGKSGYERSAQASEASEAREAMTGDSEEQWATTRLPAKRAELPLECPTESVRV